MREQQRFSLDLLRLHVKCALFYERWANSVCTYRQLIRLSNPVIPAKSGELGLAHFSRHMIPTSVGTLRGIYASKEGATSR